jgi:glycosyltransferase involved in cell wall biosynthesis
LNGSLKATVLIPTMRDRGPLLPYSVGSVLAQTVPDIEIFILGDGADDETRCVIHDLMRRDSRIQFFDHSKHERRGEPNRHAALARARGKIVCYLCDRDLMLPNHVETMMRLLARTDFGHTLIFCVMPAGDVTFPKEIDIGRPADRRWILSGICFANGIPLSFAGHRVDMYRKLPYGWRTTPQGLFTDNYMWDQFLAEPGCRAISGTVPTILYFPRSMRADWTVEQKLEELKRWTDLMISPEGHQRILQRVIDGLEQDRLEKARERRLWRSPLRSAYWNLRRFCGIGP